MKCRARASISLATFRFFLSLSLPPPSLTPLNFNNASVCFFLSMTHGFDNISVLLISSLSVPIAPPIAAPRAADEIALDAHEDSGEEDSFLATILAGF